ncbi:tetratricopeptide repeat protein [Undibacterium sp. Ji83W]|uniref:tetratricopeptide repeat protein n=1 Tax=Undibacterium sp. Ji83W TaxID=3413043 RepID=UPI003BF0E5E8
MFSKAEQFLAVAQSRQTDAAAWQFRASNLYLAQGRLQDAQVVLIGLEELQGPHPSIIHNLAYIYFQKNDFTAALALLDKGLNDTGNNVQDISQLQVLWLRCMHRSLKLEEALEYALQQQKLNRLSDQATGIASLVAVDLGNMELAATWARQALESHPEQVEALVANATVALAQKNTDLSRECLLRALTKNATDGRVLSLLGFTEMYDMKIDQALPYLQDAVVYMPKHIGTHLGLGWLYFIQRDLDAASAEFETALALDRNFSESHGAIAVIAATQNQIEKAEQHIELALRLDKSNFSAPYAQAILSGETNDAEAIKRLAQRLMKNRFDTN